jgi:hypothetical protein
MNCEKRYKEMLAKARAFYKKWDGVDAYNSSLAISELKEIFPELQGNEDEKIRESLINYLKERKSCESYGQYVLRYDHWITWLEKQGDNSYNKELSELLHKVICRFINDPDIPYSDREKVSMKVLPYVERLEKQGEQTPTNKVEPKFKVGDWITDGVRKCKIYFIDDTQYWYAKNCILGSIEKVNKQYRLWTIEDTKEGDVLAEDSCIFIIEKMNPNGTAIVHCCLFDDGEFDSTGSTLGFDVDSTKPASKEQRDLLFQKMQESGYEWDAEEKELKKIEDEPENYKQQVMSEMTDLVKDYIQQKPTWKPTEKQINAIRLARSFVTDDFGDNPTLSEVLKELEEQLKKIMEE